MKYYSGPKFDSLEEVYFTIILGFIRKILRICFKFRNWYRINWSNVEICNR